MLFTSDASGKTVSGRDRKKEKRAKIKLCVCVCVHYERSNYVPIDLFYIKFSIKSMSSILHSL